MTVVGADGLLEADTAVPTERLAEVESHRERPEVVGALSGGGTFAVRRSPTTGIASRYFAMPAGAGRAARAAGTEEALEHSLDAVTRPVLWATFAGLILAGILGYATARRTGYELQVVTSAARQMADGDLAARVAPVGPAELAEVAGALNRLAAQLAEQLGRLTAERDLLGAVVEAMEEAVIVLRPDASILLANGPARFVLSMPRASAGQPLVESVRFPAILDAVKRASDGEVASLELTLPGPPRRELLGRAAPLPRGGEARVVVVLRDVTELRRLEAVRREFVANVSHELRTPVAAIRGFAETLAGGALSDRVAAERFVGGLQRQAERLSQLIDDLLDLSRIESGGLRLTPEAVAVGDALARLADGARERARKKGLTVELPPVAPGLRVRADPRALDMVIGNFVDNAIKYTPEGGTITLAALATEGAVRLEVRDTGPGIEAPHLERIFERFYRVDAGRSRDVGGTGLGLAIAKHVALQSGGDVGVESAPGSGSRFWLRLPST